MLILGRKPKQKIIINHDFEVVVLSVSERDGKVTFGFIGDRDKYPVKRKECLNHVKES